MEQKENKEKEEYVLCDIAGGCILCNQNLCVSRILEQTEQKQEKKREIKESV